MIGVIGVAAAGCPRPQAAPAPSPVAKPAPRPPPRPAYLEVDGRWQWSHRSERDGVRRTERELWVLLTWRHRVTGYYVREVTFEALDGRPFRCSHSPTYKLTTRYQVRGTRSIIGATVAEVAADVDPGPCETGVRNRTEYRIIPAGPDALVLAFPGGEQTLARAGEPEREAARAPRLAGTWRWGTRSVDPGGAVTEETEVWTLEQVGDRIHGGYERRVTVNAPSGATLPCSGAERDERLDSYRVGGWRRGDDVELVELEAKTTPTPCSPQPERHLDTARGRVSRDVLDLTWRGNRRQILTRGN